MRYEYKTCMNVSWDMKMEMHNLVMQYEWGYVKTLFSLCTQFCEPLPISWKFSCDYISWLCNVINHLNNSSYRENHIPWPTRREWHGVIWMVDLEKEQIGRFLCFLGRNHNRIPNIIIRELKTHEGNYFILVIFIYVLDIEEYESLWWRTQIMILTS